MSVPSIAAMRYSQTAVATERRDRCAIVQLCVVSFADGAAQICELARDSSSSKHIGTSLRFERNPVRRNQFSVRHA